MNVVLSPHGRKVLRAMIRDADRTSGGDAVIAHMANLPQRDVPAAMAALLNTAKVTKKPGRPAGEYVYTEDQARAFYNQYRRGGERTEEVIAGFREYQRRAAERYRERARAKRAIA